MKDSLYKIDIHKPKCYDNSNGSIIIHDLSTGFLSFSWIDIPNQAIIADSGKIVQNLACDVYTLKIYNILEHTDETVKLDLSCAEPLSIDLLHIENTGCYYDKHNMLIEWSGGLAPYKLRINNNQFLLTENFYVYQIKPNYIYNISIIDTNGCIVSRDNISFKSELLRATVRWEPINKHNDVSNKVFCSISGGQEPYKVAWFRQDMSDKPIIVNETSIKDKFKAGNYKLIVIDSNNCKFEQNFTITEPPPISANILIFNDYSSKALFEPSETESIYNLLLIPENKEPNTDSILDTNNVLKIRYNKIDTEQRVLMDYGSITISNQSYNYYYISPGIPLNKKLVKSTLIINGKEYDLEHRFGSRRAKLVKGSLIIKDDNSFAFHNNDIIKIDSEEDTTQIKIDNIYVKSGWYLSNSIYTIINMINTNSVDPKAVLFINQYDKFNIQSLTTKSNNRLGSIICNVSSGDKNSLRAILIDEYDDTREYSFDSKYILNINNLRYGRYRLIIKDNYSIASIYNNTTINTDYFIVDILDSYEEERNKASIQSANFFNLDPSILNTYNNKPNKLLFSNQDFKNGVLMNISPIDACYKIVGKNTTIEDCGYKVLDNLPHGKYNIEIFKEGYKTQNINIFYNTQKELITVILEKVSNA